MLALLVFPMMFLRSIAYACIGVILLATVCAVVVMPACCGSSATEPTRSTLAERFGG